MKNGPYILVNAPEDYPGVKYRGKYIYEHHLVWWQNTGEVVPDGYLVHHKDEVKTNNVFSNFELKTVGEHTAEHNADKRKHVDVHLSCTWCQKSFIHNGRNYAYKLRQGRTNFFCSISCATKHQFSK